MKRYPFALAELSRGVALAALLGLVAMQLGRLDWLTSHGMSALTIAIVLGMLVGNTFYGRIAPSCGRGVGFSKQTLLRAGVVLYGLRLTLHDIADVGVAGVVIDALVLGSTFGLAWFLGTRVFGLDRGTAMLIGAGSAICGAAAVMAAEPVVRGKAEQVTVAVATVVIFGTLGIFLYPALYSLNSHWLLLPAGSKAFGVFIGSTVHEVAQVFAAGRSISTDTANIAVITKMVRVTMLAPFLIGLSVWLGRDNARAHKISGQPATAGASRHWPTIPWFAFGFVGLIVLNSLLPLPQPLRDAGIAIDTLLLAAAMAALGLTTHVSALRQAGIKPLLLAAVLFSWLVVGGALINRAAADWIR